MHISVYVPLWFWVRVCSWSCSLVARGLQAGRHFRDSKTQSTGLAPGSEGWALKSLAPGAGGGGQKKERKQKKTETGRPLIFFFAPPRPGSFGFGTWAVSFSLYMHCARAIFPAEAFSSVCILCIIVPYYIQHGFLWASQKFLYLMYI